MITSDKQLKAARDQAAKLYEALQAPDQPGVPDIIASAGRSQTQSLLDEINSEIALYQDLLKIRPEDVEIHSLEDLLTAPIRYRIASKMSVEEFSRKVGVSARQVIRYEDSHYQNITASNLKKILSGINIRLDGGIDG